jgi:hypothetical protein
LLDAFAAWNLGDPLLGSRKVSPVTWDLNVLARDVAKSYFHFLTPVQPQYLNAMQQIIVNGMTVSDFSKLLRGIICEELQAIQQRLETESRKDLM